MMPRQKFKFEVSAIVEVVLDNSLLPDDEWRAQFYNLNTLKEVAAHLAYNGAANGITKLSRLDGFANRDDSLAQVQVRWDEGETEVAG